MSWKTRSRSPLMRHCSFTTPTTTFIKYRLSIHLTLQKITSASMTFILPLSTLKTTRDKLYLTCEETTQGLQKAWSQQTMQATWLLLPVSVLFCQLAQLTRPTNCTRRFCPGLLTYCQSSPGIAYGSCWAIQSAIRWRVVNLLNYCCLFVFL